MPSFLDKRLELFNSAINVLETGIVSALGAEKLDDDAVRTRYQAKNIVTGWSFDVVTTQGLMKLNLLASKNFPFVAPIVALDSIPPPLSYPHIEDDGVLCLPPNSESLLNPDAATKRLLSLSLDLLEDGFSRRNIDDFRTEFNSYWLRGWTGRTAHFISLLSPSGGSRIASVLRLEKSFVIGEDDTSVRRWYENLTGTTNVPIEKGALLWLPSTLLPDDYPKTNSEMLQLVTGSDEAIRILDRLALDSPSSVPVIIAALTNEGPTLGGLVAYSRAISRSEYLNQPDVLHRGFRPGKVPQIIRRHRYWRSGTYLDRGDVTRADREWVHSREAEQVVAGLATSNVILIGGGAVGGFLAKLLETTGVARLTIIDPEKLTWPNTGRHYLGAGSVDEFKAERLSSKLQKDYPHLTVEYRNRKWEEVVEDEPALFSEADLVISAAGEWGSEYALNLWQASVNAHPPVIYTWMEPFASAGHAIAIFTGDGCFQCGFDEAGEFTRRLTDWDTDTLKKEPACGVTFQPYGAIELNQTVVLAARLCIDVLLRNVTKSTHRVTSISNDLLTAYGGSWSDYWTEVTGGRNASDGHRSFEWTANKTCHVCGATAT
jgi:molybdopterin/thiamine biosynthesis adenylyltransferase